MRKKSSRAAQDDLRPEYDFHSLRVVARGPGRKAPMEAILEKYEMMRSPNYRKSIAEARRQVKQGKLHRLDLETGQFRKVRK